VRIALSVDDSLIFVEIGVYVDEVQVLEALLSFASGSAKKLMAASG
jgi:hypothetical protein